MMVFFTVNSSTNLVRNYPPWKTRTFLVAGRRRDRFFFFPKLTVEWKLYLAWQVTCLNLFRNIHHCLIHRLSCTGLRKACSFSINNHLCLKGFNTFPGNFHSIPGEVTESFYQNDRTAQESQKRIKSNNISTWFEREPALMLLRFIWISSGAWKEVV